MGGGREHTITPRVTKGLMGTKAITIRRLAGKKADAIWKTFRVSETNIRIF
jgi:hypothetical protein